MKFIDKVSIMVIAGNGGNGCISFQKRGKGRGFFSRKPNGSNGGDGGDVWLQADSSINTLNYFYTRSIFKAYHGQNGRSNGCTGRKGKSIFIKVPQGTEVRYKKSNMLLGNMKDMNQKSLLIAKGGKRGIGNSGFFGSSYICNKNAFRHRIHGEIGESHQVLLELFLSADVGVFGLPNSGKSSFVQSVSGAKTKVANYPFTTLIPYLGVVQVNRYNKFVIADIPGIIKGASAGLGLGMRFLKHLKNCRILLHFIDIAPMDNSDPVENFITVENELRNYNEKLIDKPCWLVFNKIDLLRQNILEKRIEYFVNSIRWKERYYFISSLYNRNLSYLCNNIMSFVSN